MLSTLPVIAAPEHLPPAPDGFSWYTSKNGVGTFLKPDGWHVSEQTKGKTSAVFISRENMKEHGKPIVNFGVNQISDFSKNSSIKASQYAKLFIERIIKKHEVISSGVIEGDGYNMYAVRIKKNKDGVETISHHVAAGMNDRDKLYLISFQAPASEWNAYDQTAGRLFSYFILGSHGSR